MNLKHLTIVRELVRGQALESGVPSLLSCPTAGRDGGTNQELRSSVEYPTATMGFSKRLYDASLAGLGLLLLSPLFVLISLLLKLTAGGAVFYRQTRIGQNGLPFRIWKFRTMVADADRTGPSVTSEGDRRITRVGR